MLSAVEVTPGRFENNIPILLIRKTMIDLCIASFTSRNEAFILSTCPTVSRISNSVLGSNNNNNNNNNNNDNNNNNNNNKCYLARVAFLV